jgi:hypothetical protein
MFGYRLTRWGTNILIPAMLICDHLPPYYLLALENGDDTQFLS